MPALLSFSIDTALFKAIRSGLVKRKVSIKAHNGQLSLADRWVSPSTPLSPQTAVAHLHAQRVAHVAEHGVESGHRQAEIRGQDASNFEHMAAQAHRAGDVAGHQAFAQQASEHRQKQADWQRAVKAHESKSAPKPKVAPKSSRKDTLTGSLFGESELPKFTPKERPGKPAPKPRDGGTLSLFGDDDAAPAKPAPKVAPAKPAPKVAPESHQTPSGKKFTLHPREVPAIAGGGTVYDAHDEDGHRDISVPAHRTADEAKAHLDKHYHADYGKASAPDKAEQLARAKTVIDNPKTGDSLREKLLGEFPKLQPEKTEAASGTDVGDDGRDKIGVDEAHHYENGERVRGESVDDESDESETPEHNYESHPDRDYIDALAEKSTPASPPITAVKYAKWPDGLYARAGVNRDPTGATKPTGETKMHYGAANNAGGITGTAHESEVEARAHLERLRARDVEHARQGFGAQSPEQLRAQSDFWAKKHPNLPALSNTGDAAAEDAPEPAPAVDSLVAHKAHMSDLVDGKADAKTHQAAFASLQQNKETIMAELRAKTKAELDKISPPNWSGRKKDEAVRAAWGTLANHYNLDESLSWTMGRETADEALARHIGKITDDKIQSYRERRSQAIESHNQRVEEYKKALLNPETLSDFERFISIKGADKMTPEQSEKYDELRGVSKRDAKRDEATKAVEQQLKSGAVAAAGGSDPGLKLVSHFHAKLGQDVHIATMDEKVERDHFDRLVTLAKAHGGWYSRPWKGSPSGFAFKTEESAKEFMASAAPNSNVAPETPAASAPAEVEAGAPPAAPLTAAQIVANRERDAQVAAASHLRGVADAVDKRAKAKLWADRKTNTARRADMAEGVEEDARRDLQLAATMHSIAADLEEGKSTHLASVQHKTQVELLNQMLFQAKYHQVNKLRKEARDTGNPELEKQAQSIDERDAGRDSIEHVQMPHMVVSRYDLGRIAKLVDEHKIPGAARALAKIRRNCLSKPEWEKDGQVPIYRQDNLDALDTLLKAVERSPQAADAKYDIDRLRERRMARKRLEAMGIEDLPSLRAALREFLPHRPGRVQADPIKKAERALVGRKFPGYFPTPAPLAKQLVDAADIGPGMRVLEPSAGKGSLMDAIKQSHPDAQVEGIEPQPALREILDAKGHKVVGRDFTAHEGGNYDRIVMNPPFENGQDADHVRRAYDMLAPGGRLVAITGEGIHFRDDRKSREFREWMEGHGGTAERLPEGSFKSSDNPTGVNTRMVVMDKPASGANPDSGASSSKLDYEAFRKTHPAVRNYQSYDTNSRANLRASNRVGHVQKESNGEFFYTHPHVPGSAFPTAKAATQEAHRRHLNS